MIRLCSFRAGTLLLAGLLSWPAARADDPDAGVSAVTTALWRALSAAPGQGADAATLRRLFHSDGVIFGSRVQDGSEVLTRTGAAEFIARQAEPGDKGFYECEIARDVKAGGRFAVVYSLVESRTDATAAAPDFTGHNSLQLYRTDDGWKILSLYYHVPRANVPVASLTGETGRCLE